MPKPEKTGRPDNAGQSTGKGRESAPGQNTVRTFVNEAGETVTGTMQEFHATLKDQGYRQVEEVETTEPAV